MRSGVWLSGVVAAALVLAGAADAAYTSARLTVVNSSKSVGAGGVVTLAYAQAALDDPTARIVTYVPRGYVSSLVPRVGDVVGSGRATLHTTAGRTTGAGAVRAADPARYRAQAEACAGPRPRLDAAYVVELVDPTGRALELPVFVRTVTARPEAAYASAALTICFPRPRPPLLEDPPPRVSTLTLTLRGLFANPTTAGTYRWRSLWIPYVDGTAAPDQTVEAQALDLLPAQLTLLTGRPQPRAGTLFVGGQLLENGRPLPGASIELMAGTTAARVGRIAVTRTNANGNYGGRLKLAPRTWYLRAGATVRGRARNGCTVRTLPGVRCLRTTTAGFTVTSRVVRVVVPR